MQPLYWFSCASVLANVGFCVIIYHSLKKAVVSPQSYKEIEAQFTIRSSMYSMIPMTVIACTFLFMKSSHQTLLWPVLINIVSILFSLMSLCLMTAQLSHEHDISIESKDLTKKIITRAYALLSFLPILSFISMLIYGTLE